MVELPVWSQLFFAHMPLVKYEVLREFSINIFRACKIPEGDAHILGDHLSINNLVGHDSHGVCFIPEYVPRIQEKYVRWEERTILRETPIIAQIDANGGNGIVAVTRAVPEVVKKGKRSTIGILCLRNVSHVGRLGDYSARIAEMGMVGMVWMNGGGRFLAPFGSYQRRLRPEPISFAVPKKDSLSYVLDMTLSVAASGKIRQRMLYDECIPDGWVIDSQGAFVNDANRYYSDAENTGMLPLGGQQFGHKGSGLAMMIEMIVGPLTLAGCTNPVGGGGGVMMIAIDIAAFTDLEAFKEEVMAHAGYVKTAKPLPGVKEVFAPGEIEEKYRLERLRNGIVIPRTTWEEICSTAYDLGVTVPIL